MEDEEELPSAAEQTETRSKSNTLARFTAPDPMLQSVFKQPASGQPSVLPPHPRLTPRPSTIRTQSWIPDPTGSKQKSRSSSREEYSMDTDAAANLKEINKIAQTNNDNSTAL